MRYYNDSVHEVPVTLFMRLFAQSNLTGTYFGCLYNLEL